MLSSQVAVVHAFNPGTWEADISESLSSRSAWVCSKLTYRSEFQNGQGYIEKLCLEKQNTQKRGWVDYSSSFKINSGFLIKAAFQKNMTHKFEKSFMVSLEGKLSLMAQYHVFKCCSLQESL